jgi:hypothetical protein
LRDAEFQSQRPRRNWGGNFGQISIIRIEFNVALPLEAATTFLIPRPIAGVAKDQAPLL